MIITWVVAPVQSRERSARRAGMDACDGVALNLTRRRIMSEARSLAVPCVVVVMT